MKALKKLSCVLLVVLLMLSLSTTAFAAAGAADGKVTLTVNDTTANRRYVAYQILTGSVGEGGQLGNAAWGANVSDIFKGEKTPAEYFETVTDARALAEALMVEGMLTGEGTVLTRGDGIYSAEVDAGYYLIVEERTDELGVNEPISQYMVEVVNDTDVNPKRTTIPEFDKKVKDQNDTTGVTSDWQDSADWDIGDQVPFQLKATLPEDGFDSYDTYTLIFHDTLSAGLTNPTDYVVKVGDTVISEGNYTIKTTGIDDGCSFEVEINDVKAAPFSCKGGEAITVEYKATLTGEAVVIGDPGNPNTAHLEFSNNPNGEGTGNTTDVKVTVFTFQLEINKVRKAVDGDDDADGDGFVPLEGAGFTLYKIGPDGSENQIGEEIKGVTIFDFKGLDDGRYVVKETTTPPGFNTIDPIYFTVEAAHDNATEKGNLTVTHTDEKGDAIEDVTGELKITFTVTEAEPGIASTDVLNQSGLELPETGGIGTTIFYAVGGVLVAVALILLVTKKRARSEQ